MWFFTEFLSITPENFKLNADVFIETGTEYGDTLNLAVNCHIFKKYYSVECDAKKYKFLKQRFKINKDVKLYNGHSPLILDKIIDSNKKTIFWLDAHYQGGPRYDMLPEFGECPLLDELKVIMSKNWTEKPIIFIDDAQMFFEEFWTKSKNAEHYKKSDWPDISDIEQILTGFNLEIVRQTIEVKHITYGKENKKTTLDANMDEKCALRFS